MSRSSAENFRKRLAAGVRSQWGDVPDRLEPIDFSRERAMKKTPDPRPASGLHRVRLEVNDAEHLHLRMAAARLNLSMAMYARKLVRDDMKKHPAS